ncbi:hypothetical protein DFP72DRAFT_1074009 [Ephemerocybe angulata]|uniref:MYND-type domain-containing protein n=1 Tax=Ephemerocybe angulata TaxID=980116 RepID=A0A8H6HLP3_9AGAR|nr:hypothetical protein DFP72DRAFT_1074009 [Tulosesus angulatus]
MVRRWLESALVAGKRYIAAVDGGLVSTCDNITHGELRRKKCRKGTVRTCSMCHTAVYCSVKCQRADWETLHRDECAKNLEDYWDSKVHGAHLSYGARLHHRTLLEDMAKRYTSNYPLAFSESDAVPLLKIDSLQRIGFFDEFNPATQELVNIPHHFINRQNAYVDSLRLEKQGSLVTTEFQNGRRRTRVVGHIVYVPESRSIELRHSFSYQDPPKVTSQSLALLTGETS